MKAMKQLLILCLIATLFRFSGECQDSHFKPSFSVTVDTSAGLRVLDQCSRSIPKNIKGFWRPGEDDIKTLESNFQYVTKLVATECCVIGSKVDSLKGWGFQYLGVVIKGKKYIYINAFPATDIARYKQRNYDLSLTAVVVCDGGTYYWGVLFDPETKQFSLLSFNGYA